LHHAEKSEVLIQLILLGESSYPQIKLIGCEYITDAPLVAIPRNCPALLEVDFSNIPQCTNATLFAICFFATSIRELKISDNANFTSLAIPNLLDLAAEMDDAEYESYMCSQPWRSSPAIDSLLFPATLYPVGTPIPRPRSDVMDCLRIVDLSNCVFLGDQAIVNLVSNAPKIRNLTLSKCTGLTDRAVHSLCALERHVHFLHLAHIDTYVKLLSS
jgi:F-box and leucine-rich repeat protein GRR1